MLRFDSLPSPAFSVDCDDGRHLLWWETQDEQRIWILPDATATASVAAIIPFDQHLPDRLATTLHLWQRLTGVATAPSASSSLTRQQRHRLILMLRALDGRHDRASYRNLAAVLLDPDVRRQSRHDWLTSPRRAQIIRLVKDAVRRMEGGYRDLLRGR
ncbi:DUF2285 domain-containing protein [Bradyrhizobium sp. dw_78]|uniref:DUF2285 domain-containing protein n=1 Tax=Bradyrhizobium sp. dw_78 TaxID=2719793 RepID=UPI001BD6D4E0|nr:DUF2285 domain-containing protein [Bradyrhizobium sp. dw_78]